MASSQASAPPAIHLVMGKEQELADRAVRSVLKEISAFAPEAEVGEASAEKYQKGDLAELLTTSLFADSQILVVTDADKPSDAFVDDFTAYIKDPLQGAWVVVRHGGGTRGTGVTNAIKKAGFPVFKCELEKGQRGTQQKLDLIREDVRLAGGAIDPPAAEDLVNALGESLGELLAVARQLSDDSGGHITKETVHTYFRGRIETGPYEAANALVEGEGATALLLARRALATGVPPVVLVAVLAQTFRAVAKVGVPGVSSSELGMAPWQADRARKQSRKWTDEALGYAITRIADADSAVKGLSKDPEASVELCIMDIKRAFQSL
ncbi:MAG: DNA polymerase III subunit delta [Scrofimicrobium sp.]